jgi:hypothetical protein
MDFMLRQKPNVSTITAESFIMYLNKTSTWLEAKSPQEKAKLFATTRKRSAGIKQEFQARQHQINEARRQAAEKGIQRAAQQRKEKEKMKENLTNQIQELGYWRCLQDVDINLDQMRKAAEKTKALKAQLKYRQLMIGQEASKELYAFSEVVDGRRHIHTWSRLAENLKALIAEAEGSICCSWFLLSIFDFNVAILTLTNFSLTVLLLKIFCLH